MRACRRDQSGHRMRAGQGMQAVPPGKERGRAMEEQIAGELRRTCDCQGNSEGKSGVGGTSQVSRQLKRWQCYQLRYFQNRNNMS